MSWDPGAAAPATDLGDWLGRLATDEAARTRARGYWLRRQAAEEGTFTGVLADLADRGHGVVVHVDNGRIHRGRVVVLGADFVGLRLTDGRTVLIRLDAIASIRSRAGETPTVGDRVVVADLTVVEAVAALTEERSRVLVVGAGADAVSGELRAVGRDVATIRLDGDGGTAYLALASVAEISLPESG